jgi:hypothetical protein
MKHSLKLNPSVVVFAVVILTARGAFADDATPTPTPTTPKVEAQSTAVNTSRSNIRNNLTNGTAPTPTPTPPKKQAQSYSTTKSNVKTSGIKEAPTPTGNSFSGFGATNPSSATGDRAPALPLNNRSNVSGFAAAPDKGQTGAKQGEARVNSELENAKGPEITGAAGQTAAPDTPNTGNPPKAAGNTVPVPFGNGSWNPKPPAAEAKTGDPLKGLNIKPTPVPTTKPL